MQKFVFKHWLADFFLMALIILAHLLALAFLWPAFQARNAVAPAAPKVLSVQFLRLPAPPAAPPMPMAMPEAVTPEAPARPTLPAPASPPVVKPQPPKKALKPRPVAKTPRATAKAVAPLPTAKVVTPPPVANVTTPATAPSLPKASSSASIAQQESSNNSLQNHDSSNKKLTSTAEVTTTPPVFHAQYLNNPQPNYPLLSRRLREEGKVLLKVQVATSGRPLTVQLQRSSGYPRLDQAAITAVKSWRFVPAKQGEQAIVAWVIVPIDFRLN